MRNLRIAAATLVLVAFGATASQAADNAAEKPSVRAGGTDFTPAKLKVSTGETVTWVYKSGGHTVTFEQGRFDRDLNPSTPKLTRTFAKPGTYRYFCRIHENSGMKGKITVK